MTTTMLRKSTDYTNIAITLIAGFILGIITGYILFSPGLVFGFVPAYDTTLSITENATELTGNYTISKYIDLINNQTQYNGIGEFS